MGLTGFETKASSAADAVQHAKSSSKIARWSNDKVAIDQIGNLASKRMGNRNRDFVSIARKEGYMLGVPITYLKDVTLRSYFLSFL